LLRGGGIKKGKLPFHKEPGEGKKGNGVAAFLTPTGKKKASVAVRKKKPQTLDHGGNKGITTSSCRGGEEASRRVGKREVLLRKVEKGGLTRLPGRGKNNIIIGDGG